MEVAVIVELLKIAAVNGAPVVLAAIEASKKEEITLKDVEQIRELVKKPETYFK